MKTEKRDLIFIAVSLVILLITSAIIYTPFVLVLALVSLAGSLFFEFIFSFFRKKTFNYLPAIITALILVLLVPPTSPWWMVLIGSSFALFFGKAVFGGHGTTVFNPAMVGLLFIIISFPVEMTGSYLDPVTNTISASSTALLAKQGLLVHSYWELLVGQTPDFIGASPRLILLAIMAVLLITKTINWRVVLGYFTTFLVVATIFWLASGGTNPIYHLLSGSVIFGGVFVITEPRSQADAPLGKLIYGAIGGFLVYFLSRFSSYADGIIFAVVLTNMLAPMVDFIIKPRVKVISEEVSQVERV